MGAAGLAAPSSVARRVPGTTSTSWLGWSPGVALAVGDLFGEVGDVLVEVAAADDVERLGAAADRQDRHLAGVGAAGDVELEAVEVGLGRPELGVRLGAVVLGVEVGAAGEEMPSSRSSSGSIAAIGIGGITIGSPPAASIPRR